MLLPSRLSAVVVIDCRANLEPVLQKCIAKKSSQDKECLIHVASVLRVAVSGFLEWLQMERCTLEFNYWEDFGAMRFLHEWRGNIPPHGTLCCLQMVIPYVIHLPCSGNKEYFSMEYCLRATCGTLLPAEAIDSWFLIVSHMP